MERWLEGQLQELTAQTDQKALFETVYRLVHQIGFDFCGFRIDSPLCGTSSNFANFNNYPSEWNEHYQRNNYGAIDPVFRHCHCSLLPTLWTQEIFAESPQLWADACSYGLNFGWSQSVHDVRGYVSVLSLGRTVGAINAHEFYEKAAQVLWLCNLLHSTLIQQLFSAPAPAESVPSQLSPRETEVLKWMAMGKTAAEVAEILGLKTRTVGFHCDRAKGKMGVNNKISAVMLATRRGWLL